MTDVRIEGIRMLQAPRQYDRDGLDCFFVPKAQAADAFGELHGELFYAYSYLYAHYDLLGVPANPGQMSQQAYDFDVIQRTVLRDVLGLELSSIDPGEDPAGAWRRQLRLGHPVLVPLDKGALRYGYAAYTDDHSPHLMLLTGWKESNRTFVVQNGEHLTPLVHAPVLVDGMYAPHSADAETLRMLLGDATCEFYVPEEFVTDAHAEFSRRFDYPQCSPEALRPVAHSPSDDAVRHLVTLASDVRRSLEPLLERKRRFVAAIDVSDDTAQRHLFRYLNSQRLFGSAVALLTQTASAAELEEGAEAASQAWKSYAQACAYQRLSTRGTGRTVRAWDRVLVAEVALLSAVGGVGHEVAEGSAA